MSVLTDDVRFEGIAEALAASKHLDRERGLARFTALASGSDERVHERLYDVVDGLLSGSTWESKMGGLMSAKVYVGSIPDVTDSQLNRFVDACMSLLEDEEPRVRLSVVSCLRVLAERRGDACVYQRCHEQILTSIDVHFDREGEGQRAGSTLGSGTASPSGLMSPSGSVTSSTSCSSDLIAALLHSSYQPRKPGKGDMRHGTEGWKCLETSMRAFQALVEGCGDSMRPHITQAVLDLLFRALQHPNRFVRETGFATVCSVCEALKGDQLAGIGQQMARRLADGLTDNWSQVRYTACTASRSFMLCVPSERALEFMAVMLGPLCLNRHYVAEGVRQYSQETWRLVTAGQGPQLLAQFIDAVVEYYIAQTKAVHLAVREAACTCCAELCERVDQAAVAPHLSRLVRALLMCGRDAGWPVRDAACVALGRVVTCYRSAMASDGCLESAMTLWLTHLKDSVATLRDNCALALANAVRAAGQLEGHQAGPATPTDKQRVLATLRECLPAARSQPTGGVGDQATTPEVLFDPEDRDPAMFSSGLLTRFNNEHLIKADGCTEFGAAREPEPWEASDGAVRLLRELAAVDPDSVIEFLPLLSELSGLSSFPNAPNLRETIWRSMPAIAKGIGKPRLKSHLELFLPALFADVDSRSHPLAQAAAESCATALRDFIGPSIFMARLSDQQREVMLAHTARVS